jgi:predicted nuclease of predicted toxin-antitoxin system
LSEFKSFRFLADENINLTFTRKCKDLGIDVIHTSDVGLNGKSDIVVLQYAIDHQLAVLTCDSDFGRIAQTLNNFSGIVYLRPNHISAKHHLETLKHIINQNLDFQPPFILVAEHYDDVIRIRLRNSLQ